jgi:uncharacterized spore protein YtfJ
MTDLEKLLKTTVDELDRLLTAKNVLGDPIDRDGVTVIPLVSFGFGAGGSAAGGAQDTGGSGAGGGVKPVAAIILDKNGARIESVQDATTSLAHVIADAASHMVDRRAARKAGRTED